MKKAVLKDCFHFSRKSLDYRTFTFTANVSCLSNVAKQIFSNFIDVQISTGGVLNEATAACLPLHILPTALRHEAFAGMCELVGSKWADEDGKNISHLIIYPCLEHLPDGQFQYARDIFTLEVYYKI